MPVSPLINYFIQQHMRSATPAVLPILQQNADKNFVQRIMKPNAYPTMPLGNGRYATHEMAWGESDGKSLVYPTVIYDTATQKLKKLDPDAAYRYARQTGEFIPFNSANDASFFSKNYKAVWGHK